MKKFFPLILLMLGSLLMSGCIKVVMRFNPDGSGTAEVGLNMSVTALQQLNEQSGDPDPDTQQLANLMGSR